MCAHGELRCTITVQSDFDVLQSKSRPSEGSIGTEPHWLDGQAHEHGREQGHGSGGEAAMALTCTTEGKAAPKAPPSFETKRTRATRSSLPRASSEEMGIGARRIIKKTLRRASSEERTADARSNATGLPTRRSSGRLAISGNSALDGAPQ